MGETEARAPYQTIGLVLGPVAALLIFLFFRPEGLEWAGVATAAVAVWMAIWWSTEAIPVPATAFLPMVLFPILSVREFKDAAASYAHPMVYLFLGGFIIALAVERSGLHRRVALAIFSVTGTSAPNLVLGFMLAAASISMWMSNTSTTLMLLPISLSVVALVNETMTEIGQRDRSNFATAMLLGLAYGATIGGMATLVGTPPNAFLAGFMIDNFDREIDFARWMLVGVPVTLVMLPVAWLVLTRFVFPVSFQTTPKVREHIQSLRRGQAAMSQAELRTALVFLFVVLGWILRRPLADELGLPMLTDSGIAMLAALLVFIVPAGGGSQRALLTWRDMDKLPWGVLILFGGGLSLAGAVSDSGLALWLGQRLAGADEDGVNIAILILSATLLVIFLTEMTSNLATTATFLPVMAAIATQTGQDPLIFLVPVSLAASCAFMLPVATPPNAIVYGSGHISIPQMIRAGIVLNLIGVLVLSLIALVWAPFIF